jgi:hypothetical protein
MNWQRFRMKRSQFPGGAEENDEEHRLNSQSPCRDSNRVLPEYKPKTLPLDKSKKHGNLLDLLFYC